tara:strand:+ start:566 stop:835 length:270 start_codon:yes stop_codon:yes gene_type:complete
MDLPKIKNENLPKELKEILGDSDAEFDFLDEPIDIVSLNFNPKKFKEQSLETARKLVESRQKLEQYNQQLKYERQKSSKEDTKTSKETS